MKGLNSDSVQYRINNDMVNNKLIRNSRSIKSIILSNIITLFNIINIILFILVLTTGSIINTTFVFTILINTIISILSEIKAKKMIDNLTIANEEKVKVIRDDNIIEIPSKEIVLDDILYLTLGDTLVVDGIVIKSDMCEVNESVITGESDSIKKNKDDKVISGSIVTLGSMYVKVTSINEDTYANKLIKEASKVRDNSSYLKKNINNILKVVTFLIIPTGILLFIVQYFYSGQAYKEAILSTVAGIIGMIPEGLVLLTSIALTAGVIKLAKKKVIIQKLNGIETLSCVDILCLDKTGTITTGELEVVDLIILNKKDDINNIIANMVTDNVNATDRALSNYFHKEKEMEVIKRIPFSSKTKYSYVSFKNGEYALGALEYIIKDDINNYKELKEYINNGYRILSLVDYSDKKAIAFIIIKDNVRKSAKETLEFFDKQGVQVKIISGDNPYTVSNILKQLNVSDYDKCISGLDLPKEYNQEFKEIAYKTKVFGRITPSQKQMIIKALKEKNTVGMIGDGVNDILALKEADCGIALASGVSAARNVSDVVLTDSDFSVLPNVLNEGRRVVNNIERVSSMYLIKTTYSFLLSVLSIILSHEYPFYPIQLSLISAFCVGIPSFFLALEPNYNIVKKGFIKKVFRNALPSGICVFINILFIIMISYIFKLDFNKYRLTIVAITGYINLRLLYNVSKPLTLIRKILLIFCFLSFYIILFIYRSYLYVNNFNILTFILLFVLIFSTNYVTEFFEMCYDKIIEYFNRRIKSEKG